MDNKQEKGIWDTARSFNAGEEVLDPIVKRHINNLLSIARNYDEEEASRIA
ncbi:MAG: hypothetical protein Q4D21_08350 [Phascolarctobacterium sp.]|nr:hypothetical protein [Phascolarctobacterium sp.]